MEQQQTTTAAAQAPLERVFDENGATIYEGAPIPETAEPPTEPDVVEPSAPALAPAAAATAVPAAKFRIGDREFATQEEAIAYAEETARSANAQHQLLQTLQVPPQVQSPAVTPPAVQPDQVPEEFFTNPTAYLKKFGQQVYEQTMTQVRQMQVSAQQSDAIWREFTDRHPELADFRTDVESFTQSNLTAVQGIVSTKGRPAALDYIATKLKADWGRKADMLKPKRELSNTQTQRTPTQRAAGVTPPEPAKKALTFAEQINSIRKRGRK